MTSWFSQGILWGVSKVMRHHVETGSARYEEWSHLAVGMRFRAGAMGVPFMPIRSMLGSGVFAQRPEAVEMICPFTQEKVLLVPALNPDVALIHVQRADAYGNAQIDGLPVHGHRSRDGGQPRDSHDGAHRVERSDPPRAGSHQDPVFRGRRGRRAAVRIARRTSATASTSRCSGTWSTTWVSSTATGERHARIPRSLRLRPGVVDGVSRSDRPRSAADGRSRGRSVDDA